MVDATSDVEEVVQGAVAGDEAAWCELVRRYSNLVRSVAWSFGLGSSDTSDIAQMVWIRAWECLHTIRNPRHLPGWLSSVARRECIHLLRRTAREVPVDESEALAQLPDGDEVDADFLEQERNRILLSAISALPERNGALLRFLVTDPAPNYARAAREFNMPIGSIGPTRQRCLHVLRLHPQLRSYREVAFS